MKFERNDERGFHVLTIAEVGLRVLELLPAGFVGLEKEPMNNIFLLEAKATDWPSLSVLLQANQLPLDGARAHIDTFVVAVANGEVVGCAGAELYGDVALLRSVAVVSGMRKQGIGKELVRFVLQQVRRRNVREVYLLTTTAPKYFQRLGFVVASRTAAPAQLNNSAELQGACPASAQLMVLTLLGRGDGDEHRGPGK